MTIHEITLLMTALIEALMFFMLFDSFLQRKVNLSFSKFVSGIFVITIMIFFVNYFFILEFENAIGMILSALIISFLFYEGSIYKRMIAALLCMVIIVVSEIVVLNSIMVFYHLTVQDVAGSQKYYLLGAIFSKVLGITVCQFIRLKRSSWCFELGKAYWILFGLSFFCSIFIIFLFLKITYELNNSQYNMVVEIGSFCLLFSTIFSIYVCERLVRQSSELFYQKQYEQHLINQVKYFEEIIAQQKELRRFRHDINNQFVALKKYFDNGDISGGHEYLMQLVEEFSSSISSIQTGNTAFDAIISSKQSLAESKNIFFQTQIRIQQQLPINQRDLCIIFGNALDNAIEACDRLPAEFDRRIDVIFSQDDHTLFCKIINTALPNEKNVFITQKEDKISHGLGLINIREVLEKYQTPLKIEQKDNLFSLSFVIFINESSCQF